jgi:hypothetical protein
MVLPLIVLPLRFSPGEWLCTVTPPRPFPEIVLPSTRLS